MQNSEVLVSIADDVDHHLIDQKQPRPIHQEILPVSPWVAVSLLQKAIRRGDTDWALKAAHTLLRIDSARLWRRLSVIAVEDVGLGDLDAVGQVISAITLRKQLIARHRAFGLAEYLVRKLTSANKCTATENLYCLIETKSRWREERDHLAGLHERELADIVASDIALEIRAIAIRYLLGTHWPRTDVFRKRKGSPKAYFDFLQDTGLAFCLVALCREAFRQTSEPICAFLPILHRVHQLETDNESPVIRSDRFFVSGLTASIPLYAVNGFTREGRVALQSFLKAGSATSRWLDTHLPKNQQMSVLKETLFRMDSGLVKNRLIWPTGTQLRRKADLRTYDLPDDQAAELLELVLSDLPLIYRERANVWR